MSKYFSSTFQRTNCIFLSQQISIRSSISKISLKWTGLTMNKSSQIVCTFESYQWDGKSLIRFITYIVQEWMQILLKFITNKALEITTDNLRTTRLKTRNKLTNSHTIYIVHHKNWEYNKIKSRSEKMESSNSQTLPASLPSVYTSSITYSPFASTTVVLGVIAGSSLTSVCGT